MRARSSATWDGAAIRIPRERRPPLILASRRGSPHTLEPPTGATPLHERGVSGCSDRRMGFPRRPPSLTILRHLSKDEPTPLTNTDRTHSPSAPQTPGRPQQCPLNVRNRSICVTGRATVFHRSGLAGYEAIILQCHPAVTRERIRQLESWGPKVLQVRFPPGRFLLEAFHGFLVESLKAPAQRQRQRSQAQHCSALGLLAA